MSAIPWGTLAGLAALQLGAAMSPGPAFVVSVRTAASEGFRPAAWLALGFGVGIAAWAALAVFGLHALFALAPWALGAMRLIGAAFLVWIAVSLWRHAGDPAAPAAATAPRGARSAMRLGLMTNLSNPKTAAYFSAVFVGVLPAAPSPATAALVILGAALIEGGWFVLVGALFARPRLRAAYARLKGRLDRTMAGLLALLAGRIALG